MAGLPQRPISPSLRLPQNDFVWKPVPIEKQCSVPKVYAPIPDERLPSKLKQLIDPELQQYIHKAPGKGFGLVYVQVAPNGRMYVGQHNHGKGRTFATDRMNKITKGKGCRYVVHAFKKYGPENMRSFIIARAPESQRSVRLPGDTNDLEAHYVSPMGLDTMAPKGYNLVEGGLNGLASADSKKRMSDSQHARWVEVHSNPDKMATIIANNRSARSTLLNDPVRSQQWKDRLRASTTRTNAKIMADPDMAAQRREKKQKSRAKTELLKDAKKWIPLMAKCNSEEECFVLMRQYDRILNSRRWRRDREERVRKEQGRN